MDLQIRKMQAKSKDTKKKLEIVATIKARADSIEGKKPNFFLLRKKLD